MAEMSLASIGGYLSPNNTEWAPWPVKAIRSGLAALRLPGEVASGATEVAPSVPGQWSDVDEARQQLTLGTMNSRATDLAGLVMGGSYAAPAMRNSTGMGIRAYHGSPHDFDRFDIGKIGTGEGAQVQGRGLYFAENPAVAQSYKDNLGGGAGKMYEVDINADPKAFLPWDEVIDKSLLEKVKTLAPPEKQRDLDHMARVGLTGESFYKDILGADVRHKTPAITKALEEAGVPGIRYADQGSRGIDVENPTSNYVVFNDKIIDILKKYGIAAPAVGLSGLSASQPDDL